MIQVVRHVTQHQPKKRNRRAVQVRATQAPCGRVVIEPTAGSLELLDCVEELVGWLLELVVCAWLLLELVAVEELELVELELL